MENNKDRLERRCPRLGGSITFGYCRTSEPDRQPCGKIFDCWWEFFDVVAYLKETLHEDAFRRIADYRPKPKVSSLVELIEQARKNLASDESDTK